MLICLQVNSNKSIQKDPNSSVNLSCHFISFSCRLHILCLVNTTQYVLQICYCLIDQIQHICLLYNFCLCTVHIWLVPIFIWSIYSSNCRERMYIGPHGVAALHRHKYSGVDHSYVAKYVLQPFWTWFVTLFPLWMP